LKNFLKIGSYLEIEEGLKEGAVSPLFAPSTRGGKVLTWEIWADGLT
jgi:hypothetical protein